MSYIKIVHKVDAIKFTGDNFDEIAEFMKDTVEIPVKCIKGKCLKISCWGRKLWIGDYLIKDENKDLIVSGAKAFEENYKEVE